MADITLIIPTFNRKQLLINTLENIFKQSLQPAEIIVVDDHSTDGTVSFLKEKYNDKIIVLENKGNGPGSARNTGMLIATGKFIKFFDSDDLMTTNTLETQHNALTHSSKSFVYSSYFHGQETSEGVWNTDNVILNYFPFNGSHSLWHYMMVDGLFITIPGMLFRRELLGDVGLWREDVTASEDWDYLFRISLREPNPAHTNLCAFLYRLHETQTTAANFSNQHRDLDKIKVLKDLYDTVINRDGRFSYLEKLAFKNKFYQTWRASPPQSALKEMLQGYNLVEQQITWTVQRFRNKIGRWRTGTDWQRCHGAMISEEKTNFYLSSI